ncbi:transcriptional regulator Kaiso [Periophthalmus magnuspinnatus]|uniref:transcriptional regulator Kaiso n=1 Tax=Periophthalmus magnuspinnatus TaxID=409849 RepID=UPI002436EC10|nr:transcriptional regulator Kaiso [Periophthalmus magnuspinnatus]
MPSLKLISATDTEYSIAVLKSLNEQRNNGLFCDITIIIRDKKFRAHKTILSASSTYFHQLFTVAGQVIELNFIRAEIFEEILNYIYTSKIVRVRSDMLEELIQAGKILGVKFIANLASPLSQVKGLPGLSKEPENKTDTSSEVMPIITESFSISSEEFNQTSKSEGDAEDSDSDVMFVSQTAANQKINTEVIDLESSENINNVAAQEEGSGPQKTYSVKPPNSKDSSSSKDNSSSSSKDNSSSSSKDNSSSSSKDNSSSSSKDNSSSSKDNSSSSSSKDNSSSSSKDNSSSSKDNSSSSSSKDNSSSSSSKDSSSSSKDSSSSSKDSSSSSKDSSSSSKDNSSSSKDNSSPKGNSKDVSYPVTTTIAPTRPTGFSRDGSSLSISSENKDVLGVHRKQVTTAAAQQGNLKIRLVDVPDASEECDNNSSMRKFGAKQTVTLKTAAEIGSIGSISPDCRVYANIGENTYDIVKVKDDPGEGGSKAYNGKRAYMATPKRPCEEEPISPTIGPIKKSKVDDSQYYELVMDGKTFYVCVVCKRPYVCMTSLRRHYNTHSWEKQYPCRHCNKVFALAEYRTKHEIIHTGERRYQCLLCKQTFLNYQFLASHCKSVHNQDPSGRKGKNLADNNLYRLLPCKTVKMKAYSWVSEDKPSDIKTVMTEDGSVHITTTHQQDSTQKRMLNWDDIFLEPDANPQPGGSVNHKQEPEFDFILPHTY